MDTTPNEPLPDSHPEHLSLSDQDPIRFVWDKTCRKSTHNATMKKRFVASFLASRRLYKHVPEKDFNTKTVDAKFEQAFTTLRQKFRTQQDDVEALKIRYREEQKALKSRRRDRKKTVSYGQCFVCIH